MLATGMLIHMSRHSRVHVQKYKRIAQACTWNESRLNTGTLVVAKEKQNITKETTHEQLC